jgi:hypothetical protein
MHVFSIVLAVALAAPQADKDKAETLKELVKTINQAVSKGDVAAATSAYGQAESVRAEFQDKQLAQLAAAIGKGAASKNKDLALASVEALGKLKIAGSSKSLGKLLSPPAKPKEDALALHKAAIAAAGSIHDVSSLKTLEKLVSHKSAPIAAAAAEAFAGYSAMDPKQRIGLAKRLVKTLGKLEKKVKSTKDPIDREPLETVQSALLSGLSKLMNREGLANAEAWEEYLKEAAKQG